MRHSLPAAAYSTPTARPDPFLTTFNIAIFKSSLACHTIQKSLDFMPQLVVLLQAKIDLDLCALLSECGQAE